MHVCLICVEIFAWGKYGGFGRATRLIGRELAKRGVKVSAIVPRRPGQKAREELDGISVYGFTQNEIFSSGELYRWVDADVYHSEEPSLGTYLALQAAPHRKHIITFRDTRNFGDWLTEFSLPSASRGQVLLNYLYEDNFLVRKGVRRANECYAASKLLIEKARRKYRLRKDPRFLPTPVSVPKQIEKSTSPTVCFISRWDRRKRPEEFFKLARQFPGVKFIAIGASRDKKWDHYLRQKYAEIPNLQMTGFIDQFSGRGIADFLEKSWVLVNSSAREGLPNSFLEACASQCALLSSVNPDDFASNFGIWVKDGDFAGGLRELLKDDLWREQGKRGYDYVREQFEIEQAIDEHIKVYRSLGG